MNVTDHLRFSARGADDNRFRTNYSRNNTVARVNSFESRNNSKTLEDGNYNSPRHQRNADMAMYHRSQPPVMSRRFKQSRANRTVHGLRNKIFKGVPSRTNPIITSAPNSQGIVLNSGC